MSKQVILDFLAAQMEAIEAAMIDAPKNKELDRRLAYLSWVYDDINDTWPSDKKE